MKLLILASSLAIALSLTSCSLSEQIGDFNADQLTKAAEFGSCVQSCYSKTYGTPIDETPQP